jgi:hydrogenase/urease accessory protein HupE
MIRIAIWLTVAALMLSVNIATAHEFKPAYLELRETEPGFFRILWRIPARDDLRLALHVRLPASCTPESEAEKSVRDVAYIESWNVRCENGLKGETVTIEGIQLVSAEVLARAIYLNGTTDVVRFTPEWPSAVLAGAPASLEIATNYFLLGVEHILLGIDHLLFVLALLLLIADRWMLVKTVTAFTVAHSVTLSGSALGYLSLPQEPVEAVIALSIMFLAVEAAKPDTGRVRVSRRYPWVVAFSFGLLHGFGFAGALRELGLPQTDVPLALLTFNLGVEAGQLAFICAVLLCWAILSSAPAAPLRLARLVPAYAIGAVSTAWLIERLVS